MRNQRLAVELRRLVLAVASVLSTASAAYADTWGFIGYEPMVADTEVFIRRGSIEDAGGGQFSVITLTVSPVTIRGVDIPTEAGDLHYDTRYPHRSIVRMVAIDCPSRSSTAVQSYYFSGERPNEDELVYSYIDEDPMLHPDYSGGDPVLGHICNEVPKHR